jgi:tRNA 5-methylaminomethyl-2-thiouridine biosynthesis bifunctional protein
MNRSNTPWKPAPAPELDWPSGEAPRSSRFDDVYSYGTQGLDESEYVFLQGNQLPARWKSHDSPVFCIVETGFGTGLNFLLTWATWLKEPLPRPRLHYISIEKYPLRQADLARAIENWPTLKDHSATLLANYPEPVPGQHRIVLEHGALILDLWWEDVSDALPELAGGEQPLADAWYLDGFAPARNTQMWNEGIYQTMSAASRPGATFATFTAAGDVRRGLTNAGFEVVKAPGFGLKRECLRGRINAKRAPSEVNKTPWHLIAKSRPTPKSALIIGAGLAGCTAAAALAERGIQVTVLEKNQLASAGSGNDQGILYTRLSSRHSALTDFALQSFCFSHNFYQNLFHEGTLIEGEDGALCGSFHQSDRHREMSDLSEALQCTPDLAQILEPAQASAILGIEQASSGYWFPKSGWIRPAAVCLGVINNPRIELRENCGEVQLLQTAQGWRARFADSEREDIDADCAVIAAGVATNHFENLRWLPLQAIRGQTTNLPGNAELAELRAGFCHTGYISPARGHQHCIGATFDLNDEDPTVRTADHLRNLEALATAVPPWAEMLRAIDPQSLTGRVAYRCATPDYLPVIGAVPDYNAFVQTYGSLRKNAKQIIRQRGDYMPGLYMTAGHGSRGLTSTPLAAQILASQICGEALPLSQELCQALSPSRFIIRNLRRGLI